ncbi:TPA: DUF3265 domain-containing protein [Vibrio vulnificus]|nr:DUF3265 domain-containing protein [Vibrio vulnificus]HAS8619986.1 DUF3265 domain-containing protein [Vibrio vulnificus]
MYATYDCFNVSFSDYRRVKNRITNCLRVIRNAWHFHYALVLVFRVLCGGIGVALLTP